MSKFVIGGGSNLPTQKSGGLTIGSKTSLAKTDGSSKPGSTLSAQLQQAQDRAAFRQKPLLVYLMVDLSGSRMETRSQMRPHEQSLANLIMNAGGNHPVVCKGIYHRDGQSSKAKILSNESDILRFLDKEAEYGITNITDTLKQYRDDEAEDVLSLGVLIGDAYEGDEKRKLIKLASQLKIKRRPLIIAHQETPDSEDFCSHVAPEMAEATEGLEFSLGTQPKELLALIDNYRKILTATPDELKAVANGRTGGITLSGNSQNQLFVAKQAQLLLTHG